MLHVLAHVDHRRGFQWRVWVYNSLCTFSCVNMCLYGFRGRYTLKVLLKTTYSNSKEMVKNLGTLAAIKNCFKTLP